MPNYLFYTKLPFADPEHRDLETIHKTDVLALEEITKIPQVSHMIETSYDEVVSDHIRGLEHLVELGYEPAQMVYQKLRHLESRLITEAEKPLEAILKHLLRCYASDSSQLLPVTLGALSPSFFKMGGTAWDGDFDGHLDLYRIVSCSQVSNVLDILQTFYEGLPRNQAWRFPGIHGLRSRPKRETRRGVDKILAHLRRLVGYYIPSNCEGFNAKISKLLEGFQDALDSLKNAVSNMGFWKYHGAQTVTLFRMAKSIDNLEISSEEFKTKGKKSDGKYKLFQDLKDVMSQAYRLSGLNLESLGGFKSTLTTLSQEVSKAIEKTPFNLEVVKAGYWALREGLTPPEGAKPCHYPLYRWAKERKELILKEAIAFLEEHIPEVLTDPPHFGEALWSVSFRAIVAPESNLEDDLDENPALGRLRRKGYIQ